MIQESSQIASSEAPLEGPGDGLIVLLKAEDAIGGDFLRRKVSWHQSLALEDREIDLDLIGASRHERVDGQG